jgi:signal transduction histidine kinase
MGESYSAGEASGAERALARDLIARLFPSADADLLVTALLAERGSAEDARCREGTPGAGGKDDASPDAATRELRRVRRQLALAESARTVQHALNNPLTALLAEAQLLELEPLDDEHLRAVGRIVELARRVAKVSHRLEGGS